MQLPHTAEFAVVDFIDSFVERIAFLRSRQIAGAGPVGGGQAARRVAALRGRLRGLGGR